MTSLTILSKIIDRNFEQIRLVLFKIGFYCLTSFLCRTTEVPFKWIKRDLVPTELVKLFNEKKTTTSIPTCNTYKSRIFSCHMKCKTRGIQLACSDRGIVLGFRELYGSESCMQVAQMYLDLCEAFTGIKRYLSKFLYFSKIF